MRVRGCFRAAGRGATTAGVRIAAAAVLAIACGETSPARETKTDAAVDAFRATDAGHADAQAKADAGCTLGELGCDGAQPQVCSTGNVWHAVGAPCSGELPGCVGGACVPCVPTTSACVGNSIQVCSTDGHPETPIQCAAPTPACSENNSAAQCVCATTSCGGACVDTQTDPANCGDCGTVCPSGTSCTSGLCECLAPRSSCNGECIATTTSANCGACGVVCAAVATCVEGTCICPGGKTACGGDCVDETSDPANCGGCGVACLGTQTCASSNCVSPDAGVDAGADAGHDADTSSCPAAIDGVVTLASDVDYPYGLAVTASAVYWTNASALVSRLNLADCAVSVVSSTDEGSSGMLVYGPYVYWVDDNDGVLMRAPQEGGPPAILATDLGTPEQLATDGTSLYWASREVGGSIYRMPIGGGAATPLAITGYSDSVAVAGSTIFWADQNENAVLEVPSSGGAASVFAAAQSLASVVAADSSNVYWFAYGAGSVMQLAIDAQGGTPVTLASGVSEPNALATDGISVYFATYTTPAYVMKVPVGGGMVTTLATSSKGINALVVDSTSVYWTESEGAVKRLLVK